MDGPPCGSHRRQRTGLGQQVVRDGIAWLQERGARVIGLETMPRTIENIGFYSRLGFIPGHLTVTLQRERPRAVPIASTRLGALEPTLQAETVIACATLSAALGAGADFTSEIRNTLELGLGDVTLLRSAAAAPAAFALWHTAPLAHGRAREDLRILKLVAADTAGALQLIAAVEREAAAQALPRVAIRCQTAHEALYAALIDDGYRVHGPTCG